MLAAFLRSNQEHILEEWDRFARSLLGAEFMSQVSVRNHGQKILAAIADDIERPQDRIAQAQKSRGQGHSGPLDAIAGFHSVMRLEQGFDFSQLMSEFRALRATVMRLWEEHVGAAGNRDIDGIVRFNEAIDQVITEAISDHVQVTSEYRDRFTRMIGHDLRTPLAVIKLSTARLLRLGIDEQRFSRSVSHILAGINRLERMSDALLDFTRVRFGPGIPITASQVDLGAVCREALEEAETCHAGVRIDFEQDGDLQGIWDHDRLIQVVSNLVVNAIQHGKAHRPIHVAARAAGQSVELDVHNEGPPIPARVARVIFEPFLCDARKDIRNFQGGIGLGLCIVKEIVSTHGGEISLTSSEDEGTTFRVRLPRHAADTSPVLSAAADRAESSPSSH